MNSSFKKNLVIGYSISFFLLIFSSAASYFSIRSLLKNSDLVNHTNEVIRELNEINLAVNVGEAGQRGFLLTNNDIFLAPYKTAFERALKSVGQLQAMTKDVTQLQLLGVLKGIVDERFNLLQSVIDRKIKIGTVNQADLERGRNTMVQLVAQLDNIQQKEIALLNEHTDSQKKFASYTPFLILVASILSLLVTVISFLRVNSDFKKRMELQNELQQKDEEISRRISLIQYIADKISAGNYKTRVDDEGGDVLGSLAFSLNKMAASLDESFEKLTEKEWLQTGVGGLNDELIGEKEIENLAHDVITFVVEYTTCQAGAFYVLQNDGLLTLMAGYALPGYTKNRTFALGEGLAGQCAATSKTLQLENLKEMDYIISFAAGEVKPTAVIAIPILFNRQVKGVLELASMSPFTNKTKAYFNSVSANAGIAINTAESRRRVQELLAETQAQSNELQTQHSELENINAELEMQAEKLQASEEELRVQQEELQQANQELEERSRLLEEKNELILERNLEIQAKSDDLEQSTRYKSEFLANMSHELRTPLNSILLLSRLLAENHNGNLSPEEIEYAGVIRTSGNGLLTLIDEILDLSKIESGKMELEYADVEVEDVKKGLQALFGSVAKDKGIDLFINIKPNAPPKLFTDRLRLEQILRNLISNALKFTKKGGVTLTIGSKQTSMLFAVADTGIGISADKQETVFEAFKQADGSTRRNFGGTGLGLSISRELAKLLGGEIRLQSKEGNGSTFTLIIPVAPMAEAPAQTSQIEPGLIPSDAPPQIAENTCLPYISKAIPASIPDDRNTISKADKVLLIIEDDTAFALSLLTYCRQQGYKAVVAVRGDEGIELARQLRPLGILLDVQLPVKNGWQVMDELKADTFTNAIPVHMMSSHLVKVRSLSKGAVDFIAKPFAFEALGEVFRKIDNALKQHPKKVLIVEENLRHAQALAYFLENFDVVSEICSNVNESTAALTRDDVHCVILALGMPFQHSYDGLEIVKKTPGLEHLPIIIFTGKNLSHGEEKRIRQYADSIVLKTAHSYQRILDEVSLFLHLVEEKKDAVRSVSYKKMGELTQVLNGKTVLLADDDVRNIFSLTKSLETYGMNVVSAIDGSDALKQLHEHPVDLVLMDMMMPQMDGYESIRHIRAEHRYRNLPIIAVTAKAMTGDREKCMSAGASDYITKPVDIDQLISLLRVWLYNAIS